MGEHVACWMRFRLAIFILFVLMPCWANGEPIKAPEALIAAIAQARPGDRIEMGNGVWRDLELILQASGTEAEPIVLAAQTHRTALTT